MLDDPKTTQSIIDAIPNPLIIRNDDKVLMCNKNFLEFFNYKSLDHFLENNNCVSKLFQKKANYFSLSSIDSNVLWTDYLYNKKTDTPVSIIEINGNSKAFSISINKLEEYDNTYVIVFTDITAIENEKILLEKMAFTDPLTNIYNRQMFNKLLVKEKENKKRHNDALSIIMLDIDHFKVINDTYGHDMGDKVLITLAELISKHLRANDIFARWGGEEFMILLPRTDVTTAYNKAQELRKVIEEYKNTIPHFTVSFGVTELTNNDKKQSEFIRVDKALYQAKIKRNDVVQL